MKSYSAVTVRKNAARRAADLVSRPAPGAPWQKEARARWSTAYSSNK